jgi:hypothetical protein
MTVMKHKPLLKLATLLLALGLAIQLGGVPALAGTTADPTGGGQDPPYPPAPPGEGDESVPIETDSMDGGDVIAGMVGVLIQITRL